eukprot:PhF_6_TR7956/c2_g1_i6/m.12035
MKCRSSAANLRHTRYQLEAGFIKTTEMGSRSPNNVTESIFPLLAETSTVPILVVVNKTNKRETWNSTTSQKAESPTIVRAITQTSTFAGAVGLTPETTISTLLMVRLAAMECSTSSSPSDGSDESILTLLTHIINSMGGDRFDVLCGMVIVVGMCV